MRIPTDQGDQVGFDFSILFLLLGSVFFAAKFVQSYCDAGRVDPNWTIMGLICIATLAFSVMMRMRDYWIDETGVYTRTFFGKVMLRKLPRERICFFGVVPIVSGRYRKVQITFSDKMPRHPVEGYAERIRGMIHFDYTPERYAAICSIFTPAPHAVVIRPEDGLSS